MIALGLGDVVKCDRKKLASGLRFTRLVIKEQTLESCTPGHINCKICQNVLMSPSFAVAEMQFSQVAQRVQTNMKTGSEFQVAITASSLLKANN